MSAYSTICELRGRALEGQGCTLYSASAPSGAACAATPTPQSWTPE